jgi:hypothetical protein
VYKHSFIRPTFGFGMGWWHREYWWIEEKDCWLFSWAYPLYWLVSVMIDDGSWWW